MGLEPRESAQAEGSPEGALYPSVSFAFQPIVDLPRRQIVSYEALIRGPSNQPSSWVFGQVSPEGLSSFDQRSREVAIAMAAELRIGCQLNLNFFARSLDASGTFIRATLQAAHRRGIELDRIILEVTGGEAIADPGNFARILNDYRGMGLRIGLDNFGGGHSSLSLLADFQPDIVKLDMHLVRGIDGRGARQSIVRAVQSVCEDLAMELIAVGVETMDELRWLEGQGIHLFQGYLFARPALAELPKAWFP